MAKIVLSKKAPEGQRLGAAFGPYSFDAGDAKHFDTDDENLLAAAEAHPFFEVEREKRDGSEAREAGKDADAARRQVEKDNDYNATKDPLAPPAEAARAEDPDTKEGRR